MRPRLILGTAQLCDSYGLARASVEKSGIHPTEFLRIALESGIVTFDTAPTYGDAEDHLANIDKNSDIHTKFDPGQNETVSLTHSLRRLQREQLSLVYFHAPDIAKNNPSRITRVREEVNALVDNLGASEYTLSGFCAADEHPNIDAVQFPINLLNLSLVRELSEDDSRKTRIFARSVLGQGLLAGALTALPQRLHQQYAAAIESYARTCSKLGRSMSEVALIWVRDLPWIDSVVIGPSSVVELKQLYTAWMSNPLSAEERTEVESHFEAIAVRYDPRLWNDESESLDAPE